MLNGVPAGTYTVVLTPDSDSAYVETEEFDIEDIGIIDLKLK